MYPLSIHFAYIYIVCLCIYAVYCIVYNSTVYNSSVYTVSNNQGLVCLIYKHKTGFSVAINAKVVILVSLFGLLFTFICQNVSIPWIRIISRDPDPYEKWAGSENSL